MNKKVKTVILILCIYFVSLFLFEFFIGVGREMESMKISEETGNLSIFSPFVTLIEAGICHFILVVIIAFIFKFLININQTYKNVIYLFPFFTYLFTIPVGIIALMFANFLGVFGL